MPDKIRVLWLAPGTTTEYRLIRNEIMNGRILRRKGIK
jgi:hypothetical protein